MNPASQWTTIGWMIACGAAMGAVFDVFRVASRRFRFPRWLLPALDLVYWAVSTAAVYSMLLRHNDGDVRMYVFLGLGIGVSGYFGLLSGFTIRAADRIFSLAILMVSWVGKTIRYLLIIPLHTTVRLLARLLDILFVITAALLLWTLRLLLVPLKPLAGMVWNWLLPFRTRVRGWTDKCRNLVRRMKETWDILRKKR